MSPNKAKLKDKSSGDGVTSYRITSYLTLSHATMSKRAEEKGEETKEPPNDPLNDGIIVATDLDVLGSDKPKKNKKGKLVKRGPSAIEKIKNQYTMMKNMVVNTILYPFRVVSFYLDMFLENVALITQNMGAIMSLAYKAMVKQIKESKPFQGEEIYEPDQEVHEEHQEEEKSESTNEEKPEEYSKYDSNGVKKISFLDLHELNINFTDNKNNALFNFDIRKTQSYRPSPTVVDPIAARAALQAIHECAERAASIPPAMEGPYANIPLSTVLGNSGETDLQSFLRYVKVYPGNYVGRNLKISETFATWVVYGAPTP
jgi:hypothetical protein